MATLEFEKTYRCNVCGKEVVVTKFGAGTLVCCGKQMELQETIGTTVNVADID